MRRVRGLLVVVGGVATALTVGLLAPQWLAVRSTVADLGVPEGLESVAADWQVGADGPEQTLVFRSADASSVGGATAEARVRDELVALGFTGTVAPTRERGDALDADVVRLDTTQAGEVRLTVSVVDTDGALLAVASASVVVAAALVWVVLAATHVGRRSDDDGSAALRATEGPGDADAPVDLGSTTSAIG